MAQATGAEAAKHAAYYRLPPARGPYSFPVPTRIRSLPGRLRIGIASPGSGTRGIGVLLRAVGADERAAAADADLARREVLEGRSRPVPGAAGRRISQRRESLPDVSARHRGNRED